MNREYENTPIKHIVQELFSYAEGATLNAKKDSMVNMSGFIALRSEEWKNVVPNVLIMTEGFPTDGSCATRCTLKVAFAACKLAW